LLRTEAVADEANQFRAATKKLSGKLERRARFFPSFSWGSSSSSN